MCPGVPSPFSWRGLKALLNRDLYVRGAELQNRADLLRLFLLTRMREAWPHEPPQLDVDTIPSVATQRNVVHKGVFLQSQTLLGRWLAERPPPLPPESPNAPVDDVKRSALIAERAEAIAAAQRAAFGYEVRLAASTAGPDAGLGVFVAGSAPPGSVLAMFPGVAMEPADLLLLPGGVRHLEDNLFLMARFDKAIVDASARALQLLPTDALECPLAVGHQLNHVPAGGKPNVVPAPVEWDRTVPAELVPLLPNVSFMHSSRAQRQLLLGEGGGGGGGASPPRGFVDYFRESLAESLRPAEGDGGFVLKGLVFVAAREVRDEELFLNYRLNPANGYPAWYTPYDREEDARRWSS